MANSSVCDQNFGLTQLEIIELACDYLKRGRIYFYLQRGRKSNVTFLGSGVFSSQVHASFTILRKLLTAHLSPEP